MLILKPIFVCYKRFSLLIGTLILALSLNAKVHGKNPNVLFIAVDDLNDCIEPLGGHPDSITPNFNRLAKMGVTFENAFCNAPICNPSRVSLLTGRRPSSTGVYGFQPMREVSSLKNVVTLPQHFKNNGYHVMGSGKIFHGFGEPHGPDKRSFDEYGPFNPSGKQAKKIWEDRIPGTQLRWAAKENLAEDPYLDGKAARWTADKLKKSHDKPFFLAFGMVKPHLPLYAPEKFFNLYEKENMTLPVINKKDLEDLDGMAASQQPKGIKRAIKVEELSKTKDLVHAYLATVSYIDSLIGEVLDALEESPHKENTIIVLWSDHGYHMGEKNTWSKSTLWEESLRIPLFLHAPGVTPMNVRCKRTVSLIDLYPTLIDLCNLPKIEVLEGRSFLPLLKKADHPWNYPALSCNGLNNFSVRTENWRYSKYRDGSEELYDHSKDQKEWRNLAKNPEYDSVKKELAQHIPKKPVNEAETLWTSIKVSTQEGGTEERKRKYQELIEAQKKQN